MRRFSERADAEAVGAMIPCADPKPPQIRKKIAQARVTVSAVGATDFAMLDTYLKLTLTASRERLFSVREIC